MKKSIIYSADKQFQVIGFIDGNSEEAWKVANALSENNILKDNLIDHYDVLEFNSLEDMNTWILEQAKLGRVGENVTNKKKKYISVTEGSGEQKHVGTIEFQHANYSGVKNKLIRALEEHFDASVVIPDNIPFEDILRGNELNFVCKTPHHDNSYSINICETWMY